MHTIHYTFHAAQNIEHARSWLAEFDIVVVDEASNVDSALLYKLLSVLPNVCKLVLIGDLGQIYPINAGCPFHDLVHAYPQHSTSLTINKRVNPSAKLLADASACIREGKADTIEYNQDVLSFTPRSDTDIEDIMQSICNDKSDIMKIHVVVLRNIDRHSINRRVETWLLKRGMLSSSVKHKLHSKCTLLKGQKITFTKNITNKKGFDNVKNGELGQVASFGKAKQGGMVITLTNGKNILVNSEYGVPPQCVQLGYASTSNKSQGSEWPKVLFYMYEGCSLQSIWTREYPYVAISRAKEQCIIIGTEKELLHMCERKAQKRHTFLAYLLQTLDLPLVPSAAADVVYILDKAIMPKGMAAVPLLADFAPKKAKKKVKK
jgi:exodeoxyribonuclease V alpha subunit